MGFDTQVAIIAQSSAASAAQIVAALINAGGVDDPQVLFDTVRKSIFDGTMELATTVESGAPAPSRGGGFPRRSTGGAPRNPGTIDFKSGKHEGQTIAQVYEDDKSYIEWVAENSKNDFLRKAAGEYLSTVAA